MPESDDRIRITTSPPQKDPETMRRLLAGLRKQADREGRLGPARVPDRLAALFGAPSLRLPRPWYVPGDHGTARLSTALSAATGAPADVVDRVLDYLHLRGLLREPDQPEPFPSPAVSTMRFPPDRTVVRYMEPRPPAYAADPFEQQAPPRTGVMHATTYGGFASVEPARLAVALGAEHRAGAVGRVVLDAVREAAQNLTDATVRDSVVVDPVVPADYGTPLPGTRVVAFIDVRVAAVTWPAVKGVTTPDEPPAPPSAARLSGYPSTAPRRPL